MSDRPLDGAPTETVAGGPEGACAGRRDRRSDRVPAAGRSATPVGTSHVGKLGRYGKNGGAAIGGNKSLTESRRGLRLGVFPSG